MTIQNMNIQNMTIQNMTITYRPPGAVRRELPWEGGRFKYCSVLLKSTCFPFACSFATSACLGRHIASRPSASHHTTSRHIHATSHHMSHHVAPHHIAPHHITPHHIASHSLQHVSKVTSKMTSKIIPNELQNESQNELQNDSQNDPQNGAQNSAPPGPVPDPSRTRPGPLPALRKSALLNGEDAGRRPHRDPLTSPPNCVSGLSIGRSSGSPSDAL